MNYMSRVGLQVPSNWGQLLVEFRLQLGWRIVFIDRGKEIQEK